MPDEQGQGTTLIPLFDRLASGDTGAADEIIAHSMQRLSLLAHKLLKRFPAVRHLHQTDDIVQGAALRLYRALKEVKPTSADQLLRLASTQIHRELIDLARHEFGVKGGRPRRVSDPAQSTSQAGEVLAQLAEQTGDGEHTSQQREEFHEQVQNLPQEELEVFKLIFYQGMSQKDVAHELGVSESTVKRRWYDAKDILSRLLRKELPSA